MPGPGDGGRLAPHVVVKAKSPLAARPEMLSAADPVFVSVAVCGALVVLTACGANVRLGGVRLTTGTGAVEPVPERITVFGELGALDRIVSVPGRGPVTVGVKVTSTVQLLPGAGDGVSTGGQAVVCA